MGSTALVIMILLITLATTGGALFFVAKVMGAISKKQGELQQLLATGQPATGRILGIGGTGTTLTVRNHRHIGLTLTVEVTMPGRPPYTVQTTQMISELRLASVQPGAMVQVRVDPMNPSRIAIGDGPPPAAMSGGLGAQQGGLGAPQGGFGAPQGGYGAPQGQGGGAPAWGGPPGGSAPWGSPPMGGQPMGAQPMGVQPMGAPMMGLHGGGFVAPNINVAMKSSMKMTVIIMLLTTVPIAIIMLATFVDWSALGVDDDAPDGGYCEAVVRCCKVVFNDAPTANCTAMGTLPPSGCKSAYEGYQRSATAQGKTCQ